MTVKFLEITKINKCLYVNSRKKMNLFGLWIKILMHKFCKNDSGLVVHLQ